MPILGDQLEHLDVEVLSVSLAFQSQENVQHIQQVEIPLLSTRHLIGFQEPNWIGHYLQLFRMSQVQEQGELDEDHLSHVVLLENKQIVQVLLFEFHEGSLLDEFLQDFPEVLSQL